MFPASIEVPYCGKSSYQFTNHLVYLVKKKFNVDVSVYSTSFKTGAYFQPICSASAALLSNEVR